MEETQTPVVAEKSNSKMNMIAGGLIVVVLIGAGIFLTQNKKTSDQSGTNSQVGSTLSSQIDTPSGAEVAGVQDAGVVTDQVARVIEIEAGSFYYKPDTIEVKKGEKVKIVLKSVDMMHDFNIDELNVKTPITKSGETASAEFVAEEVGQYDYYCSVGEHRKKGQFGTITVVE